MAIKIKDIPPEGLTLSFASKLDLFDEGTASTAFTASITISPSGSGVLHVSGVLTAEPLVECSRCLKRFPFPIHEPDLSVDLFPVIAPEESAEHELDRSELDVEFYEGDEVDPLGLVREQLLLALPMVPLHSSDCRGICSRCGDDLNEKECGCAGSQADDPAGPFSKLKDLIQKKE